MNEILIRLQTFKSPKGALLERLKESGSVPGEANGIKSRDESAKKKKRTEKGVRFASTILHVEFTDGC